MTPSPSGKLLRAADGRILVLERSFRAPIADVWASVTEPERTARWFGSWQGEPGTGRDIKVQMAFEDGQPWCDGHIDSCEPPRRFGVTMVDDYGSWRLELQLTEDDGHTHLTFRQHLTPDAPVAQVGPGWEYYLDALGAARTGADRPDFADYYPAMEAYYAGLDT